MYRPTSGPAIMASINVAIMEPMLSARAPLSRLHDDGYIK